MADAAYELKPIGWVESPLVDRDSAPRQGDEGAPDAWLVLDSDMRSGIRDLREGTEIIVLTWLDRARRDVLVVHPRGDPNNPTLGVFSTRSPDRPNPVGLHTVLILAIEDTRILVRHLEALDRTPVLDIKPLLEPVGER
jgi:tRNA-Thr(GGU) m(6)t(6)A37 methyltransferase TsaA